MWKVDGTVGAGGSSPVAERILEHWGHDRGSVRFFRSSANFLYVFRNEGRYHFLRFADGSERSREAIGAEVELLGWLTGAGIDAALPVPSGRGNLVETVETRWGTFHAVVFPAMEGEQLEIGDLDEPGFRRWGAALGELHAALEGYPGAGSPARPDWRDHLELAREYVSEDAPALRDELEEIASALAALPQPRDTYGLIHSDFELDNLIWRDGSVGILDFDDCSRLWYVADIAFALGDLFEENADLGDKRFRAFVHGYSEHRPLDQDLPSRVPLFLRLQALLRYARLVRAVDLAVGPEHPKWLGELSRKLHARMSSYRTSVEHRRL
jgi:Ser/Thr protein kinase RdoA (MazF antagonist)